MIWMLVDTLIQRDDIVLWKLWKQFTNKPSKRSVMLAVIALVTYHLYGYNICILIAHHLSFSLLLGSTTLLLVVVVLFNNGLASVPLLIIKYEQILPVRSKVCLVVCVTWLHFIAIKYFDGVIIIETLDDATVLKLSDTCSCIFHIIRLLILCIVYICTTSDNFIHFIFSIVEELCDRIDLRFSPLIIIFVLEIAEEVAEVSNKNQRTISFIFRRIQYVLL